MILRISYHTGSYRIIAFPHVDEFCEFRNVMRHSVIATHKSSCGRLVRTCEANLYEEMDEVISGASEAIVNTAEIIEVKKPKK